MDEIQAHCWRRREWLERREQQWLCVFHRELFCCFLSHPLFMAYIFSMLTVLYLGQREGKDDTASTICIWSVLDLFGIENSGLNSTSVHDWTGCTCSSDSRGLPGKKPLCCYEYRILKSHSHRIIFLWSLLLGIIFAMIKMYFCHMVLLCQLTIHSCIFSLLRDLSHQRRSFRHLYPRPQAPDFSEGISSQLQWLGSVKQALSSVMYLQ